jgi:drug/metabolite transporter (DMT)-like permease
MGLAVPYLDPLFLTVARAAIAGVVAIGLLVAMRRRIPARRYWLELSLASACLVYGFPLFSAIAVQTVPVAHGGVVLGILPLVTTLAATLVAGERPSLGFWLAALAGGAIVTAFALRNGGGALVAGDLWLVASIFAAGFGYTYAGKLSSHMAGWEVIAWALIVSLPIALPATVWLWPDNAAAAPMPAWAALIYVALVSQLIAFFFWNAGMALGGIARVGQLQLLQPFVIVAMAASVNREQIDADTAIFAVLVVATVMVGRRMRVARAA